MDVCRVLEHSHGSVITFLACVAVYSSMCHVWAAPIEQLVIYALASLPTSQSELYVVLCVRHHTSQLATDTLIQNF